MAEGCTHTQNAAAVEPTTTEGCEECLAEGREDWGEVRVCLECGHTGCCGSSPGKHAQEHFEETGHLVIEPLGDEGWLWCYEHEMYGG